uniref:Uncharacterized protein n=1 Tax=Panagrolaimus superbus TaxID=310955 RepID=A0A914Y3K8_9BILA
MFGNTDLPPIIEVASPKDKPPINDNDDNADDYFYQALKNDYLWKNKKISMQSDTGTESEDIELPIFLNGRKEKNSKTQQFRKMVRRGKVGVLPEASTGNNNHNLFHTQTSGSQNLAQHHNDDLLNKFSKEELAEFHQLFLW